jgi:ribosomal protein L7/L12
MIKFWAAGVAAVLVLALLSRKGEGGSRHDSLDEGPPTPERIDQLLQAGRKIDAIKAYRTLHRVDLKAAKDAIDARGRELRP